MSIGTETDFAEKTGYHAEPWCCLPAGMLGVMKGNSIFAVTLFVFFAFFSASPAGASSVTFEFSGFVTGNYGGESALDSSAAPGAYFYGAATFDSTGQDYIEMGEGKSRWYTSLGDRFGMSVSVGNYTFASDPTHVDRMQVSVHDYGLSLDEFRLSAVDTFGFDPVLGANRIVDSNITGNSIADPLFMIGEEPRGINFNSLSIRLISDLGQDALQSIDLLLSPPDLSDFSRSRELRVQGYGPDGPFTLTGEVTSLTLIPEPTTATLAALGLLGLVFRRRKG